MDLQPPPQPSRRGRLSRIPGQLLGKNPFGGDCLPTRVRLFAPTSKRPTLPFPHPWNYERPIGILETYFWNSDSDGPSGKHNRYLELPGLDPVLVTRDPAIIRAILTATGDREGQFDRDTLPSTGIARATGPDTLLFSNGPTWRRQRKVSASPFGKTTLFQPERFHEFAETFRKTVHHRLDALQQRLSREQATELELPIEPEIKTVMLELLTNCFFGAELSYDELRTTYVPALERVISHIVRDTVSNRLGLSVEFRARFSSRLREIQRDFQIFEQLTEIVLAQRNTDRGLWKQFQSDAPDELLRSNLKVFLAGALEATTSFATWAISHLARSPLVQDRVFSEVRQLADYTPEALARAKHLGYVLEETLRLTPSLYFLPRRASTDVNVEVSDGRTLAIPAGTHILLDVWHANRHEDHWGIAKTGFPAEEFHPERWERLAAEKRESKEMLHFGFGHGARVCPGKHLGMLEVALVVGAFVKVFDFRAANHDNPAVAGVSTKPADGTRVVLTLRRDMSNDLASSDL
ncbi:MAG: cytochrome P450 [Planctomycetaceae bacterium]|nr:cytochrome P450 [Planctomycetaceae bacterium]